MLNFFAQVSPGHLQSGLELDILRRAQPFALAEAPVVSLQQGSKAVVLVEQVARQIYGGFADGTGAQEDCEQFCIGKRCRASL